MAPKRPRCSSSQATSRAPVRSTGTPTSPAYAIRRSCPRATSRASSVPGLASKPVCRIAVLALLVPAPTSGPASINARRSSNRESSRAIAEPTSPAPTMATSYEASEGDRALNELAPLRVRSVPPFRVSGGLGPFPDRDPVGDLGGGSPEAGAHGGERGRSRDRRIDGAALDGHSRRIGLELEKGRVARETPVHTQHIDLHRSAHGLNDVGDPPGDSLEGRSGDVGGSCSGRHAGDHRAGLRGPPRGADPG